MEQISKAQLKKLIEIAVKEKDPKLLEQVQTYMDLADPVAYCHNYLGVQLWKKQAQIARALLRHKRVLVKSANAVGKSFIAACMALWFYQYYNPGIGLITAPTYRQVKDIIFGQIRTLYKGPGLYDKLPRIESAADHYLSGFTTTDSSSYQGIHCKNLLVIFEECVGVDAQFWEAAQSILVGGENTYWLAICNPTDTTSQAFLEEQSGRWHVISISAFEHPNISAELQGKPPVVPGAIRLNQLDALVHEWCQPTADPLPGDLLWRGRHYRPGPIAEARLLGRYPSQGSYAVFCDHDLDQAQTSALTWQPHTGVQLGCDVARFGNDFTTITARRGPVVIYHEAYNGQDTAFTADRLKTLARDYARERLVEINGAEKHIEEEAKKIPIKIDDVGVGGGVVDQRTGYNFIGVNASTRAKSPGDYPNRRSELLFTLADLMKHGQISLSRLPKEQFMEIKRQALSVQYRMDSRGRRVAEPKDSIKERLGRSPDDLDSLGLAFAEVPDYTMKVEPLKIEKVVPKIKKINF